MINKILVPLDGSDEAEVILPYMSRLAVGLDVPVVLLAVLDQESMGMRQSFFSRLYERAEAGARDRLHDVAQTLGKEGVNAIEVIASGKSAPKIVEAAGRYECGLITMSTHGRNMLARETPRDIIAIASRGQSGFTRLAIGSVAEALIRGTGDPVFVVHPSESSSPEP